METHIPIIFLENGQKSENKISGYKHTKQSENIISGSENMNKYVFLSTYILIIIIKDFPPYMSINGK